MTSVEVLHQTIVREFSISSSDVIIQENSDNGNNESFCSQSYQAKVKRNGVSENLFIKTLPKILWKTDYDNLNDLFMNEAFMFRHVFIEIFNESKFKNELWNLFPKCHYADDQLMIMEDLTDQEYKLGEKFLDENHYQIALIGLAKFHAANYAYKIRHPDKYMSFVEKIKSCFSKNYESENELFAITSMHVLNKYIEKYSDESIIYQNSLLELKEIFRTPGEFLKTVFSHDNILAILCHGDFNRNNLMFRYNASGIPISVKILDLQTPRYGSPIIDIAFFAYLNSKPEMRIVHWDRLFTEYFTYLTKHLLMELQVEQLPEHFTLHRWQLEYAQKKMYGFFIVSFFLRVMMSPRELFEKIKWKWYKDGKKNIKEYLLFGNEETDVLLIEILREILLKMKS